MNYLAVPGVGIFEVSLLPMTTNHFPRWGISAIVDLTFWPRGTEFDRNFFLYAATPTPLPGRLDNRSKFNVDRIWLLRDYTAKY